MGANALAPVPAPEPMPEGAVDWRQKLHDSLIELGLPYTADAIAHAEVGAVGSELRIIAPKEFQLSITQDDVQKALKHAGAPGLRAKITFGQISGGSGPVAMASPKRADDAERRANEHPEVARFRELFGGDVRNVRNLKE